MEKNKSRRKRLINTVVNVLLVGLLILFLVNPDAKAWVLKQLISVGLFKADIKTEALPAGSPVTAGFSYQDEKGNLVSTNQLKGKVVFINFWATWCPPCRAEMPSMHDMYNKLKGDDRFVFLFINEDEDKAKARDYLTKQQYSFPLLQAATTVPAELFSGTLPTTVVINKEGRVVMKKEGIADYNRATFIEQLKSLL